MGLCEGNREYAMIIYSVIVLVVATALIVFGVLIAKGNTNLINCYREERVKDKALYCKKISQALWIMATVLVVSGVIGLLGETDFIALAAVGVLIVGIICGLSRLFYVQKKYGGGVF